MNELKNACSSVEEYISQFPGAIQTRLKKIRKVILDVAPDAIETISYGMPAYKLMKKPLAYFAAYQKHIGFYGTPTAHAHFAALLGNFKQGKGSVQFPLADPLPIDLVELIVQHKAKEILESKK